MTYKNFVKWCDKRACDGCWGLVEAMACINIMDTIRKLPFWRREKHWRDEYETRVVEEIIKPIEQKMKERGLK